MNAHGEPVWTAECLCVLSNWPYVELQKCRRELIFNNFLAMGQLSPTLLEKPKLEEATMCHFQSFDAASSRNNPTTFTERKFRVNSDSWALNLAVICFLYPLYKNLQFPCYKCFYVPKSIFEIFYLWKYLKLGVKLLQSARSKRHRMMTGRICKAQHSCSTQYRIEGEHPPSPLHNSKTSTFKSAGIPKLSLYNILNCCKADCCFLHKKLVYRYIY